MRGVFDEREAGLAPQTRDTELTLGSGTLLVILLGLVLLCILCFATGYAAGHHSSAPSSAAAPQSAIDQEPLQATGAIPKPSAITQTPVPQPQPSDPASQSGTLADAAPENGGAANAQANSAQPEVHPALPANSAAPNPANTAAQAVHPAMPQAQQYMVQVAAVSNAEDAEALANALRKRNYPAALRREPADNFIHVRIGPFATHQIAEQWRLKLLNDGYNAQIQP